MKSTKELYLNEYYRVWESMTSATKQKTVSEKSPLDEISKVMSWLKCSAKELHEKCQTNPKLLSRAANEYLDKYIKKTNND